MMRNSVLIAPSLLSADFSRMGEEVRRIQSCGGDWVHLDVMDGQYVPSISFGQKLVADLRKLTPLPFDVHLMTNNPEAHVRSFVEAGADYLTFHPETVRHAHRVTEQIRSLGAKAGVSLLPATPAFFLQELLPFVDLVLVMTVNPGFGGQKMIPQCLEKVRILADVKKEKNFGYRIAVDGGMNRFTAVDAVSAGAEVVVMGTAFFESADPAAEIDSIRGAIIV